MLRFDGDEIVNLRAELNAFIKVIIAKGEALAWAQYVSLPIMENPYWDGDTIRIPVGKFTPAFAMQIEGAGIFDRKTGNYLAGDNSFGTIVLTKGDSLNLDVGQSYDAQ
jgi:hypothetical protein